MKIGSMLTACFCLLALLQACNKYDEELNLNDSMSSTRIGLATSTVEIGAEASQEIVPVAFLGRPVSSWDVTSSDEWLSVSKSQTSINGKREEAILIAATANTFYGRQATVTLTAAVGDNVIEKTVTVTQASALSEPSVSASLAAVELSADPEVVRIEIVTNQEEWTAHTTADWISITTQGDQLVLAVNRNTGDDLRRDTLYVVAGTDPHTASLKIPVTQAKSDNENEITINGIQLVLVKAGTYYRGAQNTDPDGQNYYPNAAANQGPVHQVTITKDFYIGKYEVTQAQYEQIMGNNPSAFVGATLPVEMVDYTASVEFTQKLSAATGMTFRLPTEAEWEYAARGGQSSQGYIYSGSNFVDDVANYSGTGVGKTQPVGTHQANELGIHDMSGNVYEWCSDHLTGYTAAAVTDPVGAGTRRILRGGSWFHSANSHASSYRGNNTDNFARNYLGLRVVYVPQ